MRSAPEPKDEKARLEALYQYDILDTDAEDVFDDFFGGLVIEDDNVAIDVKQGESICQKTA